VCLSLSFFLSYYLFCAYTLLLFMANTHSNSHPIKVATLNCRGTSYHLAQKLYSIQQTVLNYDLDILLLQETHVDKLARAKEIEGKLHCKALWSFGAFNSRGTAVLIFNDNHTIHKFHLDLNGRLVFVDLTVDGFKFRIISVYVPDEDSERRIFLNELYPYFSCNLPIIMGGDMNCIMKASVDKIGGNPARGLIGSREIVSFCSDFSLVDPFRFNHPHLVSTTWHRAGVSCRLDRFYVSKNILALYKSQFTYPFGHSDHDLVVLTLHNNFKNAAGPGYWKLNTSVLTDFAFRSKFVTFWWQCISGAILTQNWWDSFKKKVSYFIKDYCVRKAKAKRKAKRALQNEYFDICKAEKLSPGNFSEQIVNLKQRIKELEIISHSASKIRSKAKDLDHNESASKYFFKMEHSKSKKKEIGKIINLNGDECTSSKDILNGFSEFYAKLFTSEGVDDEVIDQFTSGLPILSEDDVIVCEGPITLQECYEALRRMKSDKSPGPDGLPKEFYLTFFDILGSTLVIILNLALINGQLSASQRLSFISLICKDNNNSENLRNWRPISLCCVDYKILTKVLSMRLGNVLENIIHSDQTCSIKGRTIFDNVHLLRNVQDYVEQKQMGCGIVSLDFEKAFDRVEHTFLQRVLHAFGFGDTFCNWVDAIYTNIYSSVIVNNFVSNPFLLTRGVRQGCSLSPLLFVLVLEPLLIKIR
jgi:exonuclease III